jgi:hypothetical protein
MSGARRRAPKAGRGGRRVRLLELAHARSGDKGDTANVGLIARKPEHYALLVVHGEPRLRRAL